MIIKTIKSITFWVVSLIALVAILGVYKFNFRNDLDVVILAPSLALMDIKNLTYAVDGEKFSLINGVANNDIVPGSATKNTLNIFGEPVYGDLNGDGKANDAAIILVNNPGGSGTFFYTVLAINDNGNYKTTNTILLGDRISPQTVEIDDGLALYNYADRKANESMAAQPSVGKSLWVKYNVGNERIEVVTKDVSVTKAISNVSLTTKKWEWVKTQMNNDVLITPKKSGLFTLSFSRNGDINIGTDCNSMGGKYKTDGSNITFSQMMSTMMYCSDSQEQDFSKAINNVKSYMFTSSNELILEMKMDSGTMLFK